MVEQPGLLQSIVRTTGPIRQRAASVAASFVTFMGCNCGRAFTHGAEMMAASKAFYSPEDAYLAAWVIENKRVAGSNNGLRTVEYMLASNHPISDDPNGRVIWGNVPDVSMDDIDVVESMVAWWSSNTAKSVRLSVECIVASSAPHRVLSNTIS